MVAVPHFHLPSGSPPSLRGIEHAIAALPAHARAELTWAVPTIRSALRRFLDGSLDGAALTGLTRTLLDALVGLVRAAPAGWNAPLLEKFESNLASEVDAIARHSDGVTADAVEWAMRTWLEATRVLAQVYQQEIADDAGRIEFDGATRASIAEAEDLPCRLEALLFAVMEAASSETYQAVVPALADDAYDLAQRLCATWRERGVEIDPWRGESRAARGARAVRYFQQLRSVMTDEDIRVIEASRLRNLR